MNPKILPPAGCGGCRRSYGCRPIYVDLQDYDIAQAAIKGLGGAGADGFAAIRFQKSLCGLGGERGNVSTSSINKLTGKIQIRVGKGGSGALNKDTNAAKGETTKFGNLIIADGGHAGDSTTSCPVIPANKTAPQKILGNHGQPSVILEDANLTGACGGNNPCKMAGNDGKAFDPASTADGVNALYYGSGGGGGAVGGCGGNGANGIVIVKW